MSVRRLAIRPPVQLSAVAMVAFSALSRSPTCTSSASVIRLSSHGMTNVPPVYREMARALEASHAIMWDNTQIFGKLRDNPHGFLGLEANRMDGVYQRHRCRLYRHRADSARQHANATRHHADRRTSIRGTARHRAPDA